MNTNDSQSVVDQLSKLYDQQTRDGQLAQQLRELSLPTLPIDWHNYRITFESATDESIAWHDVLFLNEDHCLIWLADIVGQSMRHTILGNAIEQRITRLAFEQSDSPMSLPERSLNRINRDLRNVEDLPLLSIAVAVYNQSTRTLRLARAGALQAQFHSEQSRTIGQAGPFLGTIETGYLAEEIRCESAFELSLSTHGEDGQKLTLIKGRRGTFS